MTVKVFTSTFRKYLPKDFLKFLVSNSFNKCTKICVNCLTRSSHTQVSDSDSNLYDRPDVQKYLKYLLSDSSFIIKKNPKMKEKLEVVQTLFKEKANLENEIKNLMSMSCDENDDLEKLREEEKTNYINDIHKIKEEILEQMVPLCDEDDDRDVELQIIPAIGGLEAKLFGEELLEMYANYVNYKNWKCVSFEKRMDKKSGFTTGYIVISGDSVFKYLKHEAGVHRVQRVPVTEKSGRTQTSTCSVAILPQPKPSEIVINQKDVKVEKILASGPGGQNVNKTESCVRVKHIPTGVTVECQTSRYQFENMTLAFDKLRRALFSMQQDQLNKEKLDLKNQQVGTSDYSEKIRTYHYIQNRVTDHRINFSSHNLRGFMNGNEELDEMITKVIESSKIQFLLQHIDRVLQSTEFKNFEKKNIATENN